MTEKVKPLYYLVLKGDEKAIKYISSFDQIKGDVELAKYLIATNGLDSLDTPDESGFTAMHHAAFNNHISIIELLVTLGSKQLDGQKTCPPPINLAASQGHCFVIRKLIELGSQLLNNNYHKQPMYYAAMNGHANTVLTLHELGSKVGPLSPEPFTRLFTKHPVHMAAKRGHINVVKMFIESFPKWNIDTTDNWHGTTAVHYAAKKGHSDVIEILVKAGSQGLAIRNSQYHLPIDLAIKSGHMQVINKSIELNQRTLTVGDREGNKILHRVAIAGHTEIIHELVIRYGVALDKQNKANNTPMHLAVIWHHPKVVKKLFLLGSQAILMYNGRGDTPVHMAVAQNNARLIEKLYKWGNKFLGLRFFLAINSESFRMNHMSDTPLIMAITMGYTNIVKTLVRLGASLYQVSNMYGDTAVHLAAKSGSIEMLDTVIELQKNERAFDLVNARNDNGQTPIILALWYNKNRMIEALVDYGALLTILPHHFFGTLLQHAVSYSVTYKEHIDVKMLVRFGEQVDAKSLWQVRDNKQLFKTMLMLAASDDVLKYQSDCFNRGITPVTINPEKCVRLRYEVYFSTSLVHKLLRELAKSVVKSSWCSIM
jgi:ankyrin repeat protein